MSDDLIFLYVTVPDHNTGMSIGKTLVTEKLAACANLLPPHDSIYEWDGKLEESKEQILLLKTRKSLGAEAESMVAELHPYECPCVLKLPINSANKAFQQWVMDQTQA